MSGVPDLRWHLPGTDHPERVVTEIVKGLVQDQSKRCELSRKHFRLYEGNPDVLGAFGGVYPAIVPASQDKDKNTSSVPISMNVVESVIDTAAAMVCESQPRPRIATRRGDFAQQRTAEMIDKAIEGHFSLEDVDELQDEATTDAIADGTGIIKAVPSLLAEAIVYERRMPWELFFDPLDAQRGKPQCWYEATSASKYVLAEEWAKGKSDIRNQLMNASTTDLDSSRLSTQTSDHVPVFEAWSLPYGSVKGRHIICAPNIPLCDEEWTWNTPPFALTWWKKRRTGIWGKGLAEIVEPIQNEIDRILLTIQEVYKQFASGPLTVVPDGVELPDDRVGAWIQVPPGGKVTRELAPVMQSEVYNHLWQLYNKAYELPGVSQAMATSTLEPGLEQSGRAQIIHHNISSKRFVRPTRYREGLSKQLAHLTISGWEYLDSKGIKVQTRNVAKRGGFAEIDLKKYKLDVKDFVVSIWPVSKLSTQPESQMAMLEQLTKLGYALRQGQYRKVLETLDLDAEIDVYAESETFVQRQIDSILVEHSIADEEAGEWAAPYPDPMSNLEDAKQRVQAAYMQFSNDADESDETLRKLDLMRAFELAITDAIAGPAPEPAAANPVVPGAPPMPPVDVSQAPGQAPPPMSIAATAPPVAGGLMP
jgi:hypothetical protein